MLLIVSNKSDLATDYLVIRLHERGVPFLRINTEDYLSAWDASIRIESKGINAEIVKYGQDPLPVEKIVGAYIRQPKLPGLDVADDEKEFSKREVGESLKSLWRSIGEGVWLNAPKRMLLASNKPEQLAVASSLGFYIPDTFVGSDCKAIEGFYKKHSGEIIAKAVKHGFDFDGKVARVAATQKIDEFTLSALNDYAAVPMIFQNHIEKECDVRVTVLGERVMATAIESQDYAETTVDWRLADCHKIPLIQYRIDLPEKIQNLCVAITKIFGLRFSAIDLVLGRDGNYYFLELNPNGQWAWIEQLGIFGLRDMIIDELLFGRGEQ